MRLLAMVSLMSLMGLLGLGFPAARGGDLWSLKPLTRPPVPAPTVQNSDQNNPIDSFVQDTLQKKGLKPAPPADRRTLLRRAYFDLLGLPPTPAQMNAFLADTKPLAWERAVDGLLASPHHGEKMARFWMDIVHFGETHGHDQDRIRPHAWPYRDYLVKAFNDDRPWARFVKEQLASDQAYPDRPDLIPALGLLAAGPWDESSLRDIREDSIDREIGHYLDRDDIITTVMSSFQGVTVHCARCHDHKFDPVGQEEYYRLQAVFAGIGRGNRAFEPDPIKANQRQQLAKGKAGLEKGDRKQWPAELLQRLASNAFQERLLALEGKVNKPIWQGMAMESFMATNGSKLVKLSDGSIRAEGPLPQTEITTVLLKGPIPKVSALRLELLTDPALPHKGPGRCSNGNLHLNEIVVHKRTQKGDEKLFLRGPLSDFDQDGWTVQHAVDGNPDTAWGIHPREGEPHEAIFPLALPVTINAGESLVVRLDQTHGREHLIGRFRLEVTETPGPFGVANVTQALREFLAKPRATRLPSETLVIEKHILSQMVAEELLALGPMPMAFVGVPDFEADGSHKPPGKARPVHLLKRGEIRRKSDLISPGSLDCLNHMPLPPGELSESKARAWLADWIGHKDNPLTWRTVANRVWQAHFGKGIVATPNDFGNMGEAPTHPELLDYLATLVRDNGGHLKPLHRLILTSSTWMQATQANPNASKQDSANRLYWTAPRRKLDAEQVRDAVLLAAGRLDTRMGGPSEQQFLTKASVHVTPTIDYKGFDWTRPANHRRSVYRFIYRTLPDPLVESLDGADATQFTPVRTESTGPLQALALWNDPFILAMAEFMAADVAKETGNPRSQVALACQRLWGREPNSNEAIVLLPHLKKAGLASLCRVLMNSSEFLYLD